MTIYSDRAATSQTADAAPSRRRALGRWQMRLALVSALVAGCASNSPGHPDDGGARNDGGVRRDGPPGGDGGPSLEPEPELDPEPMSPRVSRSEVVKNLVAFWTTGASADDENRYLGWGVEEGWGQFIDRQIIPALDRGVRRIHIHNPFGRDPDEGPMSANQYLEAKEQGYDKLTETFVPEWQKVISGEYTGGEPVRVTAYLGTLVKDPDFEELYEAGKKEEWMELARSSVAPFREAGMDIGLDAVSIAPDGHYVFDFVDELIAEGEQLLIETWPKHREGDWGGNRVGVVVSEARMPHVVKNFDAHIPPSEFTEVGIIIRPPFGDDPWYNDPYNSRSEKAFELSAWFLRQEYTAIVPFNWLDDDITVDDIVGLANEKEKIDPFELYDPSYTSSSE